jgi:hypothetical protein
MPRLLCGDEDVKPGAFPLVARDAVRLLRASRIREVANTGMGRPDVFPQFRPLTFVRDS